MATATSKTVNDDEAEVSRHADRGSRHADRVLDTEKTRREYEDRVMGRLPPFDPAKDKDKPSRS